MSFSSRKGALVFSRIERGSNQYFAICRLFRCVVFSLIWHMFHLMVLVVITCGRGHGRDAVTHKDEGKKE